MKLKSLLLLLSTCLLLAACGKTTPVSEPSETQTVEKTSVSVVEEVTEDNSKVQEEIESFIDETVSESEVEQATEENDEVAVDEVVVEEPVQETEFHVYDENELGAYLKDQTFESLGVKYQLYSNGAEVAKLLNEHGVIEEEIEVDGIKYPVTSLGGDFLRNVNITEFEIPAHIKYIKGHAFSGSELTEINIPDTVKYIDPTSTFSSCHNLKAVTFPSEFIVMPHWNNTFAGSIELETVELPEGVTRLEGTFSGCSNLKSVKLPDSLITIDEQTFDSCRNLEELIIPGNVKEVKGPHVLDNCGMKTISIPDSVERFDLLYLHCPNLEELIIPDSVTDYGTTNASFAYCDNLKILKYSNNAPIIEFDFARGLQAENIELIIFPDSLENLKDNSFIDIKDPSKLTIQVPEKTVQYFQSIFPEVTVVAKN